MTIVVKGRNLEDLVNKIKRRYGNGNSSYNILVDGHNWKAYLCEIDKDKAQEPFVDSWKLTREDGVIHNYHIIK